MTDTLRDEIIQDLPRGVITKFELDVLRLRRKYASMQLVLRELRKKYPQGIRKGGRETEIDKSDVYGAGYRIRERRRRSQTEVNFWNNVASDKRIYSFITPKPRWEDPDTGE